MEKKFNIESIRMQLDYEYNVLAEYLDLDVEMLRNDSIITGGCIPDMYNGLKPNDIDFFIMTESCKNEIIKAISKKGFFLIDTKSAKGGVMISSGGNKDSVYVTDKAITLFNDLGLARHQLIFTKVGSKSPYDVVEDFDFSLVCHYIHKGVITCPYTDIGSRTLHIKGSIPNPIDTLMRVSKYVLKGYSVSSEFFSNFLNEYVVKLEEAECIKISPVKYVEFNDNRDTIATKKYIFKEDDYLEISGK